MRFITFKQGDETRVGVRKQGSVVDLSLAAPDLPKDLLGIIETVDYLEKVAKAVENASDDASLSYADLVFAPLIQRPPKIICIGRNYAAHAKEGGAETPTYPEIFFRGAESLIGHQEPIIKPKCSDKLDYEGEIVAVIGKKVRHCSEDDGLDAIAGYALFNDATLRDYQRKSSQWTIGKNFDGTGAFGPEFVTKDELPAGMVGSSITTRLNGNVMQNANTDDLVFPMKRLVAILSECMTLLPGDIIITGTPAGVGYVRNPPVFMKAGDVVEVEVPGLGTLSNTVKDE